MSRFISVENGYAIFQKRGIRFYQYIVRESKNNLLTTLRYFTDAKKFADSLETGNCNPDARDTALGKLTKVAIERKVRYWENLSIRWIAEEK